MINDSIVRKYGNNNKQYRQFQASQLHNIDTITLNGTTSEYRTQRGTDRKTTFKIIWHLFFMAIPQLSISSKPLSGDRQKRANNR